MLRALTLHGVRPDWVVGSSVGALNAAYFAGDPSSHGVELLEALWRSIGTGSVFPASPWRALVNLVLGRDHLVTPTSLRKLIEHQLPYRRLEDARLPCHIVAADVLSGDPVRLSQGSAVEALLATTAIPGIFPPVRIDDRLLVDGGVASNTPIATAVALGARQIVVLATGAPCTLERPPRGAVGLALHALTILIARQLVSDVTRFADTVPIAVVPPLCPLNVSSYDFSRTGELIDRAANTTADWLEHGGLGRPPLANGLAPHRHDDGVAT